MLSITHELKSPLASVKLGLQTLKRTGLSEENFNKIHSNSLDDVDRLEMLMDNILLAAKIDSRQYSFEKEELNLTDTVKTVVERLATIHGHKRAITSNLEQDIIYIGDKVGLSSVVINLVENAIKYSDSDDQIHIDLKKKDSTICIEVADTGQGIPEHEIQNVFKKFYRLGNEETRSAKGTGLGLFIVQQIVEQHHGKIAVSENKPKGSIFTIQFPTQPAS